MDHNQNIYNGFFQNLLDANPHIVQQIGQALQTVVRGMAHAPPPPPPVDANQNPSEDDPPLADLPHLEPVPHRESVDDMDVAEDSTIVHSSDSQSADSGHTQLYTTDEESLVDPSTNDVEMRDVEMTAEGSSSHPSAPSEPASSAMRGSRRARVDDDEDDDAMRETNRQRMHSPETLHQELPGAGSQHAQQAPDPQATGNTPQLPPPPPLFSRIFYSFDIIPPASADGAQPQADPHAQPDPHTDAHPHPHDHLPPPLPTINLSFNVPITPPGAAAPAANTGEAAPNGAGNGPQPEGPADAMRQFFQQMFGENVQVGDPTLLFPAPGGFATFPFPFGMHREEQDDPDRANKLIAGLDGVPTGLVQRMERVGGSGAPEDDSPVCAICWERLLDVDAGGFGPEPEDTEGSQSMATGEDRTHEAKDVHAKKIVVLPCSHVFHTSCLLPWFSKPHRTTCPTCRFDIDPESLTYMPRRRQRPRAPSQPQGPPPAGPQPSGPGAPVAEAQVHDQSQPTTATQAGPGAAPASPNAVPGQAQGRPAGLRLPPVIAFDFNVFVPVLPPAGDGPPLPPIHGFPPIHGLPPIHVLPTIHGFAPVVGGVALPPIPGFIPVAGGVVPPPPIPGFTPVGFGAGPGATAAGLGAGPLPGFMHLEEEAARGMFERMFGVGPRPAGPGAPGGQQPQANPQPQRQPQPQHGPTVGGILPGQIDPNGPAPGAPRIPFAVPPFESLFMPPFAEGLGPVRVHIPPQAPAGAAYQAQPGPRPPKPQWTLPAPPGPTLRQRIERKEQEMGLRCSDISCGLGPSDDDPVPVVDARALRLISVHPFGKGPEVKVCEHTFHPSCLVSAERVAGWGADDKEEERGDGEVEVSCPTCRAVGYISGADWDEGACTLV